MSKNIYDPRQLKNNKSQKKTRNQLYNFKIKDQNDLKKNLKQELCPYLKVD